VEGDDLGPVDYCAFLPGLGENKHKRVLIQFGESNCVFTLRNCQPVLILNSIVYIIIIHLERPSACSRCTTASRSRLQYK